MKSVSFYDLFLQGRWGSPPSSDPLLESENNLKSVAVSASIHNVQTV